MSSPHDPYRVSVEDTLRGTHVQPGVEPSLSRNQSGWLNFSEGLLGSSIWDNPLSRWLLGLLGLGMAYSVMSSPLDLASQSVLGLVTVLMIFFLRKIPGRFTTIVMICFSLLTAMRYIWWRMTDTLGFETTSEAIIGYALAGAEFYAFVVLVIAFFQTAWPLERKPVPLPKNNQLWPTVDVFITTYNEPLEVVKQTIFSAKNLDWPVDKLKVYLLDDGRRDEFRKFCFEAGINYITRDSNINAKAGNLNHALAQTRGEFVAMFDCDHIPARSFLQVCMGWFLKDPKLAMLQTPHVFFSPDPFEKNLETYLRIPNESELFYGIVQDGNDLWNATMFCGSCAIMRRAPLLEVGGVAVETVTEDAHTSLKLTRAGYNTCYLKIPQAAGLSTESLSAHIRQRIRWARGLAQIARIDNPFLIAGLSFGQRLCYFSSMLHFFYGLPRLIFLTAPLAYVFFGANLFQADPYTIMAYALAWQQTGPHEGRFVADPQFGDLGSYDAIRCYLWAGITAAQDPAANVVQKALQGMSLQTEAARVPPEKVQAATGVVNGSGPVGFSAAVLPLLMSQNRKNTDSQLLLRVQSELKDKAYALNYYDHALCLFGLGFADKRFSLEPSGRLQTSWEKACATTTKR